VSSFTDGTLNKLTRLGKLYRLLVHDTDQGREDYMELQDIPGFAPRSDAGADGTAYDFTAAGYTAYDDGRIYDGIAAHTNSGACTADFGNGAWPIKLINGNDPAPGDIQVGDRMTVLVDATNSRFVLLNPASTRLTEQLVPAATQTGAAINRAQAFGLGQTWQDVGSSRAIGTTYTNSTGRPIAVSVTGNVASNTAPYVTMRATVGGMGTPIIDSRYIGTNTGNYGHVWFIVPDGTTYRVNGGGALTGFSYWQELR